MYTPHIVSLYQTFNLYGHLHHFDQNWPNCSNEPEPDRSSLFKAVGEEIAAGHIDEASYSLRDSDGNGLTILYLATLQRDLEMVDYLLESGASIVPVVSYHDPFVAALENWEIFHNSNFEKSRTDTLSILKKISKSTAINRPDFVVQKFINCIHILPPTVIELCKNIIKTVKLSDPKICDYINFVEIPNDMLILLKKNGVKMSMIQLYHIILDCDSYQIKRLVTIFDMDFTKVSFDRMSVGTSIPANQIISIMQLFHKLHVDKDYPLWVSKVPTDEQCNEFKKVLDYYFIAAKSKKLSGIRPFKNICFEII